MNPGAGNQYFPYIKWGNNILNIHQDGYIRCLALTILMIEELQAHLLQPQVLARCQNPFPFVEDGSMPESSQNFFAPYIFREQEGPGTMD